MREVVTRRHKLFSVRFWENILLKESHKHTNHILYKYLKVYFQWIMNKIPFSLSLKNTSQKSYNKSVPSFLPSSRICICIYHL